MIFRRRSSARTSRPGPELTSERVRRLGRRTVDIFLISACVALVVYLGTVTYRVVGGYTLEEPVPRYTARLQVVNATGTSGAARRLTRRIESVSDLELAVEVVELDRFEVREVAKSFIVSRQEDLTAARTLAERLGLDPDEVEYKPLENNARLVTATLVLGLDGVKPATNQKET